MAVANIAQWCDTVNAFKTCGGLIRVFLLDGKTAPSSPVGAVLFASNYSSLWWIFSMIPLPAPFGQIARVVIVVIFCIWLIYLLVPLAGGGFGHPILR
jgi:hypothetical protein